MKKYSRFLLMILALCLCVSMMTVNAAAASAASGSCGENVTWTLSSDGTLTISGSGEMDSFKSSTIPWKDHRDSITKVVVQSGVTSISPYAFNNCENLTAVSLPNTLTEIPTWAFYCCESLTEVTVPEGVTSIGQAAFGYCESLSVVTLPNTLTSMGNYVFSRCESLTSVTLPNSLSSMGNYIFEECDALTSITFPVGITEIPEETCSNCDKLTSVTFNGKVTSIGRRAFANTNAMTSFTIPSTVTTIGDGALSGAGITSITIPASVSTLGSYVFSKCNGLTEVTIPDTVKEMGNMMFEYCENLKSVKLPSSVTSVPFATFMGCYALTDVSYPDTITEIGNNAFSYCYELTSVKIPNTVTTIGEMAFSGCRSLKSIHIPASVTTIGDSPFYGCTGLGSITVASGNTAYCTDSKGVLFDIGKTKLIAVPVATLSGDYAIPGTVTYVGSCVFEKCSGLTGVTIPASVTEMGDYPFIYCENLKKITVDSGNQSYSSDSNGVLFNKDKTVLLQAPAAGIKGSYTIPNTVTELYYYAFEGCAGMTDVVIPSSVTRINEEAFSHCNGLTSVKIPASVGYIGSSAFTACSKLKEIVVDEKSPNYSNDSAGALLDKDQTSLIIIPGAATAYTVPDTVTYIAHYCAWYNENLKTLVLPAGNAEEEFFISYYAFAYCTNLKNIVFSGVPGAIIDFSTFRDVKATCYYPADDEAWDTWVNHGVTDYNADGYYSSRAYFEDYSDGTFTWKSYSKTAITTQPTGQKVRNNTTAKFTVKANGPALSYQWQFRTGANAKWQNATATGNKTATLKVPATTTKSGYQYRCVITDAFGNKVTTKAVYLYVLGIKTQPTAKNVKAGVVAKFTVNAAGFNKTFQWQYKNAKGNWVNATAPGNKTATLKVTANVAFNGRMYRCVIKDSAGNQVISNAVKLTVFGVKTQPTAKSVKAGVNAKFSVTATGSGLKYQWQYLNAKGVWVNCTGNGAKTQALTVKTVKAFNGRQYRCRITDSLGRVIFTRTVKLTVK